MSPPRIAPALFALAALALFVAGCGGSNSTSSSTAPAPSASGSESTLAAAEISGLGPVLVDSEGLTVYEFAKDKGTTSSCYGACAQSWPPVIAQGKPTGGEGAMQSQLGTTRRKDGTMQVTYAGRPLYTFAGDSQPGEANGNESTAFGGKWSALNESGEAVAGTASGESESGTEESSEGSSGYSY